MDDRKAWLKDRQLGVGGTDVACLAGVGFLTPEQVYEEKVAAEPIDRPPNDLMRMGLATEALNAAKYSERTGRRLIAPGLVRAETLPWLFATYDRCSIDLGTDYGRPVDLKYTPFFGDEWGPDGTDEVKDGYVVQATWQVTVLRVRGHAVDRGDIAGMDAFGNQRVYTIPFNADLSALLLELGEGFWYRVEHRLGLDGWEPKVKGAIAQKLAAIHPDTSVVLDEEAAKLATYYESQRALAKHHEQCAEGAKQGLLTILGTHETGLLPDGRRVRQRELTRKSYTVAETKYRDFRILAPKKEKTTNAE